MPSFAEDVKRLADVASGRNLSHLTAASTEPKVPQDDDHYKLSAQTEQRISEDFAFLTASEYASSHVSAASIVAHVNNPDSILSIACNQRVESQVQEALGDMVSRLKTIAELPFAAKLSSPECSENLLKTILNVHQNRVLGRLGSPHYKAVKKSRPHTVTLLGPDLRALRNQCNSTVDDSNEDKLLFLRDIDTFLGCAAKLNNTRKKCSGIQAYVDVIKAAFDITLDGASLKTRLDRLGLPPEYLDTTEARHLQALSKYWRICLYLPKVARTYRKVFRQLKLNPVYYGSKTSPVHAEIQLLIHHEINNVDYRPRFISSSKKPCFLCHTFVSAYGWYAMPDTHGQLYNNWHLPQGLDCCLDVQNSLCAALERTHTVVVDTIEAFPRRRQSTRPSQAQSVINMTIDILSSAVPSTVMDIDEDLTAKHILKRADSFVLAQPGHLRLDCPNVLEAPTVMGREISPQLTNCGATTPENRDPVHPNVPRTVLTFGPDTLEIINGSCEMLGTHPSASIHGVVDLDRLKSTEDDGQELTFRRPDNAESLILTLRHPGHTDVRIGLRWDIRGSLMMR